jgi:hypothetical protein
LTQLTKGWAHIAWKLKVSVNINLLLETLSQSDQIFIESNLNEIFARHAKSRECIPDILFMCICMATGMESRCNVLGCGGQFSWVKSEAISQARGLKELVR